ncbi:MAG: Fur family transcriptional regulator [Pseudoclavibacter sp.]|nr:Fur family transcriptional regulator [Pseudoclavibacter sp.]
MQDVAATEDWPARLRELGRRVTRQRLAVLEALELRPHATAEEVHADAARTVPGISLQAVYLMLAELSSAGLLRRFDAPRQPARYETRTGDNHHHLVCEGCGRVEDVECTLGRSPCLTPSETHGFLVEQALVTFLGRCPQCADAAREP